jgi:eukaryotic-like serine/threonine-protein kinase
MPLVDCRHRALADSWEKEWCVPVACPHCKHSLSVKIAKPGRYTPKCPKCGQAFLLVVAEDPNEAPRAGLLPAKKSPQPAPGPHETAATLPDSPRPAPKKTPPRPVADPDVTGDFSKPDTDPGAKAPTVPQPQRPAPSKAPPRPAPDPNATSDFTAPDRDPHATEPEVPDKRRAVPKKTVPRPAADPNTTSDFTQPEADPEATGGFTEPAEDTDASEASQESATPGPNVTAPTKRDDAEDAEDNLPADKRVKVPKTLGGFRVVKQLGRGGMGAVFLGRQLSLDRAVALKVMNPQWASDPEFVARFTREAYAAAQLTHHNVVQIYDIGLERDTHFFAMEFVEGRSLGGLLKREGKLPAETAVGYVLQAARGLKFGHDMGMIHRDVKPDNLMLNTQGIVKVADLGLVKVPGLDDDDEGEGGEGKAPRRPPASLVGSGSVTQVGVAMGTPTYMAPEQARDAAHVDGRADIYSLGCTLYALLTGQPPFSGKTVNEVLSKHATAPLVPPEVIVKRVPKAVSSILIKMMAKKPEDRYADMGEVIKALEGFLGIQQSGPFTPREEHLTALEECVQKFNAAPLARVRSLVFKGLFGGAALLFVLLLLIGQPAFATGMIGLALATCATYFVAQGVTAKTHLFMKTREYVLGASLADWGTWFAGVVVLIAVLFVVGHLWAWLACLVIGGLSGLGLHFGLDPSVANQQAPPLEEAEKLFKRLRLQGLEEEALRLFVCKNSGKHWEGFFEEVFGYEAKLTARVWVREEAGELRQRHAAWRDPLERWIATRQQSRRETRERKLLQQLEEKALKARGVSAAKAREQSEQMAHAMVDQAAQLKVEAAQPRPQTAQPPAARALKLMQAARRPKLIYLEEGMAPLSGGERLLRKVDRFMNRVLGPKPRFLAGALLLVGCLLWMNQNNLLVWSRFEAVVLGQLPKEVQEAAGGKTAIVAVPTTALNLAPVPAEVTGFFHDLSVGVAGLILLLGAFCRGWVISLWLVPCAVLACAGPLLGVPAVGPLTPAVLSMAAGFGGALVGYVVMWLRR